MKGIWTDFCTTDVMTNSEWTRANYQLRYVWRFWRGMFSPQDVSLNSITSRETTTLVLCVHKLAKDMSKKRARSVTEYSEEDRTLRVSSLHDARDHRRSSRRKDTVHSCALLTTFCFNSVWWYGLWNRNVLGCYTISVSQNKRTIQRAGVLQRYFWATWTWW
jgi:hypothetical protein